LIPKKSGGRLITLYEERVKIAFEFSPAEFPPENVTAEAA
jgi:hypothetical protein